MYLREWCGVLKSICVTRGDALTQIHQIASRHADPSYRLSSRRYVSRVGVIYLVSA